MASTELKLNDMRTRSPDTHVIERVFAQEEGSNIRSEMSQESKIDLGWILGAAAKD